MLSVDITHDFDAFHLEAKFDAPAGVTALFGPSGTGKSTIIKAIAGLFKPDQGKIYLDETCFLENGRALPAHLRALGVVFQDARLFPHLNVLQNLKYGARFTKRQSVVSVDDVVELLNLGALLKRHTLTLSGGEAQRVAIGRALLSAPRMLLLDEPLASLDPGRKQDILPYLERLKVEADLPILYVSHSMDEITRLAHHLVLINEGKVHRQGPIFDVLGDPICAPMVGIREAGAIIHARVEDHAADGLSTLRVAAGALELPGVNVEVGRTVRLRILARDVIIATRKPVGLSAMNRLPVKVVKIHAGTGPGTILALDAAGDRILSRVTSRTVERLRLREGTHCYAVLKAMSVAPTAIGQSLDLPPVTDAAPEKPAETRNLDPTFLGNSLRQPLGPMSRQNDDT